MNKLLILLCLVLIGLNACTVQQAHEGKDVVTSKKELLKPIGVKTLKEAMPLENFLSYKAQEAKTESYIWQEGILINKVSRVYINNNHNMTLAITDTLGITAFTLGWDDRQSVNTTSKIVYKTSIHGQPAWIEYSKEFEEGYGEVLIDERILVSLKATHPTTAQDIEFFLNAVNIRYLEMIE